MSQVFRETKMQQGKILVGLEPVFQLQTSGAKTRKGEELSFAAALSSRGLVTRDIYIKLTWLAMAVFSTWIRG